VFAPKNYARFGKLWK